MTNINSVKSQYAFSQPLTPTSRENGQPPAVYKPYKDVSQTLYQTNENSFAHLRSQINNLRSQFSRLINNDEVNMLRRSQNEKEMSKMIEHASLSYSRKIDNANSIHSSNINSNNGWPQVSPIMGNEHETKQQKGPHQQEINETTQYKFTFSGSGFNKHTKQQRHDSQIHAKQELITLELEVKNLRIKITNSELQNQKLAKQLSQQRQRYEQFVVHSNSQLQRWRESCQKCKMSLSMKNELVDQLQACLKRKTEQKLALVEQIQTLYSQNSSLKEENRSLQDLLRKQAQTKNHSTDSTIYFTQKIQGESELVDLRKRVQSYKKSIEQLNSTHNSTRQKLAEARQENKKLKVQNGSLQKRIKDLVEEGNIKQALINSLYQDINLLDAQMKQIPAMRQAVTVGHASIDKLNQIILQLQCEVSNKKYQTIMEVE